MHIYVDMYECTHTYVLFMKIHAQRKRTAREYKIWQCLRGDITGDF